MSTYQSRPTEPALLNEQQVAAWLGVSRRTVQAWRLHRKGPASVKLGAAVRYEREAVLRFVQQGTA